MDAQTSLDNFNLLAEAPNGVPKLREMILQLAVQGKLVPQDQNDDDVRDIIDHARLIKSNSTSRSRQHKWVEMFDSGSTCEIPPSWEWVPLGNLIHIVRGVTFPSSAKSQIAEPSLVPCLRTANVQDEVEWDDLVHIAPSFVKRDEQWVRDGDVLISMANSYELVGKVCIVERPKQKATFGGFIAAIRTECLDHRFLLISLRGNRVQRLFREGSSQTTNIANISIAKIQIVPIAVPPLAEQKRIVAKVDQLMALCDELEVQQTAKRTTRVALNNSCLDRLLTSQKPTEFRKNWKRVQNNFDLLYDNPANVQKLRQAILQLAVMGKLVPQDPNDEPASVLLKKVIAEKKKLIAEGNAKKPKDLTAFDEEVMPFEIPHGWTWCCLWEIINPLSTLSYGVLVPGPHIDDGIPFVRVKDLSLTNPPQQPEKRISPHVEAQYIRTRLNGGEILLGVVGSIGKLGVAPNGWRGANIARAVCRISPLQVYRDYLVIVLSSHLAQAYFLDATRTLAQPTLNIGQVERTPIPLPPFAEQKRIVAKVDQMMNLCDELEAQLMKSETKAERLMESVVHHLAMA